MWCDIFNQIIASLISGVLIVFIFFVLNDFIFKIPNMNGYWNFTTTTQQSAKKSYEGMMLTYSALIWMEGKNIYGTGEKISENSKSKGVIEHIGKDRTQVKIRGYVKKKYLSRDRIIIHLEERGKNRDSSAIQFLKFEGNIIKGKFIATAADSKGLVEWKKKVDNV